MQWEKPLMEAHAKVLCMFSTQEERGADVLNVGFGMGFCTTGLGVGLGGVGRTWDAGGGGEDASSNT